MICKIILTKMCLKCFQLVDKIVQKTIALRQCNAHFHQIFDNFIMTKVLQILNKAPGSRIWTYKNLTGTVHKRRHQFFWDFWFWFLPSLLLNKLYIQKHFFATPPPPPLRPYLLWTVPFLCVRYTLHKRDSQISASRTF